MVFADPDLVACETSRSTMKGNVLVRHGTDGGFVFKQAPEVGSDVDGAVLVSIQGKTSVDRTLFVLATA